MAAWVLCMLLWGCPPVEGDTAASATASEGAWVRADALALTGEVLNHPGPTDVVVVDDEAWALSLHSPTVARVDLASGALAEVLELGRLLKEGRLALDPDGTLWLGQAKEPALFRYDLDIGELTAVEQGLSQVAALAYDGEHLWALGSTEDGAGLLVRVAGDGTATSLALEERGQALGLDPDLDALVVGGGLGESGSVTWVDRDRVEATAQVELSGPPTAVWPVAGGAVVGLEDGVFAVDSEGVLTPWWQPDSGQVRAIEPDGNGAYWVLSRQAERDEDSGVLYGVVSLLESGGAEVLTARGGYNAQFLAVAEGGALTNSEGSSALVWTSAAGERTSISTGTSVDVVRADPGDPQRQAAVARLGEEVLMLEGGEVTARWETDGWPVDLAWTAEGTVMVLEHHRGRLVEVDPNTGEGEVFVDGLGTNHSLVFSTLASSGTGWVVAAGDADEVVALEASGEVSWRTALGDPQAWTPVDVPDQLQVLRDGEQLWVLRTRDARLHLLEADGGAITAEWDLALRDWGSAVGRERPQLWALSEVDGQVWVGPFRADADGVDDEAGVDAERVLGRVGGQLLVAEEEAWGPQGEPLLELDEIHGGGAWVDWDEQAQAVWVTRFARGTVERWIYEE